MSSSHDVNSRNTNNSQCNQYQFCSICDARVHMESKHCKRCNRCTLNFDHHCTWLNNCIGYNNYKLFLVLVFISIISTLSVVLIQSLIYSCIIKDTQRYDLYQAGKGFQFILSQGSLKAFAIICLTLDTFVTLALVYLFSYHIWLIKQNLTTFQHIQQKKERIRLLRSSKGESSIDKKFEGSIDNYNSFKASNLRTNLKINQTTAVASQFYPIRSENFSENKTQEYFAGEDDDDDKEEKDVVDQDEDIEASQLRQTSTHLSEQVIFLQRSNPKYSEELKTESFDLKHQHHQVHQGGNQKDKQFGHIQSSLKRTKEEKLKQPLIETKEEIDHNNTQ